MTKIIAYSYNGKVQATEVNEQDVDQFIEDSIEEFDQDVTGQPAYSIYNTKVNNVSSAIEAFTLTYMTTWEEE